jgi:nitroreductase
METEEAIKERRSIRRFLDQAIEEEKIDKILKAGIAAPSGVNCQPWEFFLIKDKDTASQIAKASPYANYASKLMIVVAGNRKRFYQGKEDNGLWIADCSAASENMLIEATSLNLGSVWCALFPDQERMKKVREILKADDDIVPFAILQFGYSAQKGSPLNKWDEKKVHII